MLGCGSENEEALDMLLVDEGVSVAQGETWERELRSGAIVMTAVVTSMFGSGTIVSRGICGKLEEGDLGGSNSSVLLRACSLLY